MDALELSALAAWSFAVSAAGGLVGRLISGTLPSRVLLRQSSVESSSGE